MEEKVFLENSWLMLFLNKLIIFTALVCFSIPLYSQQTVFFSPNESIEKFIIDELDSAEKSIKVCVFIFEWKPLCDALIKVQNKGVDIQVITDYRSVELTMKDETNDYYESSVTYLVRNGVNVQVYNGGDGAIMHNKFVLIDNSKILIGSYNFQKEAEISNHENFFSLTDPMVVKDFVDLFESLKNNKRVFKYVTLRDSELDFYMAQFVELSKSIVKFCIKYLSIPLLILFILIYKKVDVRFKKSI